MAVSVKDFLDAIRGRYQDEANKVEVTGSVVEIALDIVKNVDEIPLRSAARQQFSFNSDIGYNLDAFDASRYRNLKLFIVNGTNKEIELTRYASLREKTYNANNLFSRPDMIQASSFSKKIPSGSRALFDKEDIPVLGGGVVWLLIEAEYADSDVSGEITYVMVGEKI